MRRLKREFNSSTLVVFAALILATVAYMGVEIYNMMDSHKPPVASPAAEIPASVPNEMNYAVFEKMEPGVASGERAASKEERLATLTSWPLYKGYYDRLAKMETDLPDLRLFERIVTNHELVKQPLVQVRDANGVLAKRHPWKFEKIIHQMWVDDNIPATVAPWVASWVKLHPQWTYMFWTDRSAVDFIADRFPALLPAYQSYELPVQRADVFRYVALYAFGGVSADIDLEALRSLDSVRDMASCVLSREPDLHTYVLSPFNTWANNWTFACNALIACRAHHPFMHYLISRVVQRSPYIAKKQCEGGQRLECTGPLAVGHSYAFYRRSVPEKLRARVYGADVICPAYDFFIPTYADGKRDAIRKKCADPETSKDARRKELCEQAKRKDFRNEPTEHSYTKHHWQHSHQHNDKEKHVDLKTVADPLIWSMSTLHRFSISYEGL